MREGVACVIGRQEEFSICGFAADKRSALALVEQEQPDVLLVGFQTGKCDVVNLAKELRACCSETRVIVTGVANQELYGERLLRAGAAEYLPANSTALELVKAIGHVIKGAPGSHRVSRDRKPGVEKGAPVSTLTDRELYVFSLIGRGLGTGEIAHELEISRKTIEYYREQIKKKLGYRDGVALHKGAIEWANRSQ